MTEKSDVAKRRLAAPPSPIDQLLENLAAPSRENRPMPLWVWNGRVSRDRITVMLEDFARKGCGGVYIHPRPGLITPYLSDEWFELWAFALAECQRLDLECNIYDENSYPSGFGGGHVTSTVPYAAINFLVPIMVEAGGAAPVGKVVGGWDLSDPLCPVTILESEIPFKPALYLTLETGEATPWTGWFPYVDLTRPEVAKQFLKCTHEEYAKRFQSAFGSTIRKVFTDEPLLGNPQAGYCAYSVLYSRHLEIEFRAKWGYDLLPVLCDLFLETSNSSRTRYHYFCLVQTVWIKNFLQPQSDWCAQHGLTYTGHLMEHTWPYPYFQPSAMNAYQCFHMPGIDLLAPDFHFDDLESSADYLLTVREVASAARFKNLPVMAETHGVGGHEATLNEVKRLSDWLMVHGVTNVVPHLSFSTISGARKMDHPQTFSDHNPLWECFKPYADHVARVATVVRAGRRQPVVGILQPNTSAWVQARAKPSGGSGTEHGPEDVDDPLVKLKRTQSRLTQELCNHRIDFDLLDELATATTNAELDSEFQFVVIPEGTLNLTMDFVERLERWLQGGTTVFALANPLLVDGSISRKAIQLQETYPDDYHRLKTSDDLIAELKKRVTPPLDYRCDSLAVHARFMQIDALNQIAMFVNTGTESASIAFQAFEGTALQIETQTGNLSYLDGQIVLTKSVEVSLEPAATQLYLVSRETAAYWTERVPAPSPPRYQPRELPMQIALQSVTPDRLNSLALDYVSIELFDGRRSNPEHIFEANRRVWQAHGFRANPWDRGIQFRASLLEKQFSESTGYKATYRFTIETLPGSLFLAVEKPWLYECIINGRHLRASSFSEVWLDETMRLSDISSLARTGENTVTLDVAPFHIECEVDRVYLVGEFGTALASSGMNLAAAQPLALGDWAAQGLYQYAGNMDYLFTTDIPEPCTSLRIGSMDWRGTAAQIILPNRDPQALHFSASTTIVPGPFPAGPLPIKIRIVGSLKNLLGPHFSDLPLRNRWTTPAAFAKAPAIPPPGEAYEILPYGLYVTPSVTCQI